MHKKYTLLTVCCLIAVGLSSQVCISETFKPGYFPIVSANSQVVIYVDSNDHALVQKAAEFFEKDIEAVTGKKLAIVHKLVEGQTPIIIGSFDKSPLIRQIVNNRKIRVDSLEHSWEAYQVQTVEQPVPGVKNALVIMGSDRRGAAYAVFELSRQMGVSPWYYWADVPVKKKQALYYTNVVLKDKPVVKYRGIFINDEAPALSGWSKEKFGGFNHLFYEKVFELILRLKGNYLWPAMWGNAFNDDDSLNPVVADQYGIVMGTSHHEPMVRAHDEWRRYGTGKWNYDSNDTRLRQFWREGIERMNGRENIVSIGMRGDGDEPMTQGTAIALLERIVNDQRKILQDVTQKDPALTPQLWALYKEVQDYYDKGMRVPDDVTLLLCDDNWGNIRKLPRPTDPPRKGGYGIYYHFDYVGGPRNYKWLNTVQIERTWEQMHLAYEYGADRIWIVNVGDIKPMEFPISFFLDYAWDPNRINAENLPAYYVRWATDQFGTKYATAIADIIATYTKYNARRKPELLNAETYSFNYNEWSTVVDEYNSLLKKAEAINDELPAGYKDAYFQLVLHPVKACANLHEMYYNVALNKKAYAGKWQEANTYADKVKQLYLNDSLISLAYHQLHDGKWNHMMSQTHIGYVIWQQPATQKMPQVYYVPADSAVRQHEASLPDVMRASVPPDVKGNVFYQDEVRGVSIEANHFTRTINSNGITWTVLPNLGKTGSAITPFPATAKEQQPMGNAPRIEYDFYAYGKGDVTINAYFSPTLNFNSLETGMQYAVSIDNEAPQVISVNKDDAINYNGGWNRWVANNIIIKQSKHQLLQAGKHTVKYWMVHPGVVLQKLVLDFGGLPVSYLGPPETIVQ